MSKPQSFMRPARSSVFRYGLAVLAVAIALGIKLTLLHFDLPYPLSSSFLAAIAIAFWYGGTGPGVIAVLLSSIAFGFFVVPYQVDYRILLPDGSIKPVYLQSKFRTTLPYLIYFILVALLTSWFSSSRRSAERLLSQARSDLEVKVENRTVDLSQANQQLRAEVTERKRAEWDLRRSEAFLAEAQRLSRSGSFGWRVSTGEILWSEETFRIFQYDRSTKPTIELILQRVHPEDAALVKQTFERASEEGKNFDHEYRLVMPDSSVKFVHVVAHSLSSESGGTEFIGAVMDITIAKKSEDRIRQIIDTVPALIWTARPDGSLDFISQRWLDYAGITLEQKQGSELGEQCHPDDCDQLRRKWRAALAEGKPFETEARVRGREEF